jgi:hypothetical protein
MHRANIDWRFSNRHPRKACISRYYQLSDSRSYSGQTAHAHGHAHLCCNRLFHVIVAADSIVADERRGERRPTSMARFQPKPDTLRYSKPACSNARFTSPALV